MAAPAPDPYAASAPPADGSLGQPLLAGQPAQNYGAAPGQPDCEPVPVQVVMWGPPEALHPVDTDPPATKKWYRHWSSGLCDCCQDPAACCCMFCPFTAPCFRAWRIWAIVDRVGSMHMPCFGKVDKTNAFCFAFFMIFMQLVSFGISAKPKYAWMGTPLFVTSIFFFWFIYKGVQSRFHIQEGDCCPFCTVFCCTDLVLLKLGRHVDGYAAEKGHEPPHIPVIARPCVIVTPAEHPPDEYNNNV